MAKPTAPLRTGDAKSTFLRLSLFASLAGLGACQFIGTTSFDVGFSGSQDWLDRSAASTVDGDILGAVYDGGDGFVLRLFTEDGVPNTAALATPRMGAPSQCTAQGGFL